MSDTPPPELVDRLARMFHENYERLAPSFGYETRRESAVPWDEVPEQNRSLMRATVAATLAEWADGELIDPSSRPRRWLMLPMEMHAELTDPADCCDGDPLWLLSPREGEHERCPAGICRRPAGHAGPHSDLPRGGER